MGKLDGLKASEWKKCRCHQKIRQRTKKKIGQATLHESCIVVLFCACGKKRSKKPKHNKDRETDFWVHFSNLTQSSALAETLAVSSAFIIIIIYHSLHYKLSVYCVSRLKEPAAGSGPVPPCCGGTTKCRQSLAIFLCIYLLFILFWKVFYLLMEFICEGGGVGGFMGRGGCLLLC